MDFPFEKVYSFRAPRSLLIEYVGDVMRRIRTCTPDQHRFANLGKQRSQNTTGKITRSPEMNIDRANLHVV
jgi:hypothetical protein